MEHRPSLLNICDPILGDLILTHTQMAMNFNWEPRKWLLDMSPGQTLWTMGPVSPSATARLGFEGKPLLPPC